MHISILLAHPNPGSFNHAIADAAASELRRLGHRVTLHDLYREGFDPLLPAGEITGPVEASSLVTAHCREIVEVDGIIIVHPNWWGQPPAILKGWIDRVLRPGTAYKFVTGDNGEGVPVGLLKAKAAIVFNTANTPADREAAVFGDPLESIWKKCVFALCGVPRVERRIFAAVVTSNPAQRQAWLAQARHLAAEMFPPAAITPPT